MIILKIKAVLTPNVGGGIHYNYPAEYDPEKITVLCYEHVGDKGAVVDRGTVDEYLIGVVSDEDAVQFLKSDQITQMSVEDAHVQGRQWRPQVDKILDQSKVISILAKSVRGDNLSPDDLRAIDPDDPTPGINKSEIFDNLLSRHL